MKSLQCEQKVGCLKNLGLKLCPLMLYTFFFLRAPFLPRSFSPNLVLRSLPSSFSSSSPIILQSNQINNIEEKVCDANEQSTARQMSIFRYISLLKYILGATVVYGRSFRWSQELFLGIPHQRVRNGARIWMWQQPKCCAIALITFPIGTNHYALTLPPFPQDVGFSRTYHTLYLSFIRKPHFSF